MKHFQIGEMRCTLLSDGRFIYPRETMASEVSRRAGVTFPAEVSLPYTALLIESPTRKVLVDTGAGPLGAESGKLPDSLRLTGVRPEQIGTVLLTHAHADHIGGFLTTEGGPAFPHAEVMIARGEWEFWLALSTSGKLGTGEVNGNPVIEQLLHQWLDKYLFPLAGRVVLLEQDTEVVPGVEAFGTPGHTPGHLAVGIASEGQSLLYLADLLFFPQQVDLLGWGTTFDTDLDALSRSRFTALSRAAGENSLVAACHGDKVGYIERTGSGFRWVEVGQNSGPQRSGEAAPEIQG